MIFRPATLLRCSLALVGLLAGAGCALMGPRSLPNYTEAGTGMEMIFIPGGRFLMGDATGRGFENERPTHKVRVDSFFAGKYEVTFDQYDRFCEATGRAKPADHGWGRGTRPVVEVSWEDAKAFADWLSAQSGFHFTLPSEAQWEYLARAGTTTPYWTGNTLPEAAADCVNCGSRWDKRGTAPVGSFQPNPFGLYDTAGNVREWCLDSVHKSYQGAPSNDQPWSGGEMNRRILRGGSWRNAVEDLRSAYRDWDVKTEHFDDTGLRLVILPPLPGSKDAIAAGLSHQ